MSFFGILNKYERRIVKNVEQFGCHIFSVFDPDGIEPTFVYSVGFNQTVEHPEVIIFGLDPTVMANMINETLRLLRDGLQLQDDLRVDGLIEGFAVVSKQIWDDDAVSSHLISAQWLWGRENKCQMPLPFQLVWPGAVDGLYPWDAGCDQFVIDQQSPLYRRRTLQ